MRANSIFVGTAAAVLYLSFEMYWLAFALAFVTVINLELWRQET